MKIEIAKSIVEAAEDMGEELELRESYSGRGMYGKETAGIVFDSIGVLMAAVARTGYNLCEIDSSDGSSESPYELEQELIHTHMDSMGLGTIIY